jgi:hypothetical protein
MLASRQVQALQWSGVLFMPQPEAGMSVHSELLVQLVAGWLVGWLREKKGVTAPLLNLREGRWMSLEVSIETQNPDRGGVGQSVCKQLRCN